MVLVAVLTARLNVPFPTLTTAGACPQPAGWVALQVAALTTAAQPAVRAALQVAVLITATVPENGSEAYSVWLARSIAPTLACGCAIGIVASGAHPDRCP